jgi:N-acetylmuramoyl-L-alanine amidase
MMKPVRILIISKRILALVSVAAFVLLLVLTLFIWSTNQQVVSFEDPGSGIIVIDAGHGGIDGGVGYAGALEKDINLSIALKVKACLEQRGYTVVMTRDKDVSLDHLNHSSSSRHKRDLNARVDIINTSNAQLFISIHVNSNNRTSAKGSIVFYDERFEQNELLAYSIQRQLNELIVNGMKRTTHDPQKGEYYVLSRAEVPGVIVETAFITNREERALLSTDGFQEQLAEAIAAGTEQYFLHSS